MAARLVRAAAPPLVIAAVAAFYLNHLWGIRVERATNYNDFFALPVTMLLIGLGVLEVLRSTAGLLSDRRRRSPEDATAVTGTSSEGRARSRKLVRSPELAFAVLLLGYVVLYAQTSFVVSSLAFAAAAPTAFAALRGTTLGWRVFVVWMLVAAGTTGLLVVAFSGLLGVPLG